MRRVSCWSTISWRRWSAVPWSSRTTHWRLLLKSSNTNSMSLTNRCKTLSSSRTVWGTVKMLNCRILWAGICKWSGRRMKSFRSKRENLRNICKDNKRSSGRCTRVMCSSKTNSKSKSKTNKLSFSSSTNQLTVMNCTLISRWVQIMRVD